MLLVCNGCLMILMMAIIESIELLGQHHRPGHGGGNGAAGAGAALLFTPSHAAPLRLSR